MQKYWEAEKPLTITANKNVLHYYREAEKLSVARPNWTDDKGVSRQGKTVTLDIAGLLENGADVLSAARGLFTEIVTSIDERLALLGE